MARLITEIEVETVEELLMALATLPVEMPVSDAVGELLCLRVYEDEGKRFLEVA